MIVIKGERNILIGLASGQLNPGKDGQEIASLDEVRNGEVSAIYIDGIGKSTIPDLLIVDTPHMQEFFAWSSTYLPQWSPLSSNIRVVEKQNVSEEVASPIGNDIPTKFFRGLLCLAIGELLYEWRLANGQSQPSLLSLRSTFGYVATCSLMSSRYCLNDLLSQWSRAQHLLQLNPRKMNFKTLKYVWSPIFSLAKSNLVLGDVDATAEELGKYISSETRATQGRLFGDKDVVKPTRAQVRREDVVVELEDFIGATKLEKDIDCFAFSSIASRMSASPLSHFDVLADMNNTEPRSLLWYSFLSGLLATDTATLSIERLLFKLEGDFRTQPSLKPDVSIDELDVLIRPNGQLPDWVGIGGRFINVELEPGICSSFRLKTAATPDVGHVPPSEVDDKQVLEGLLSQLRDVFERSRVRPEKTAKRRARRKKATKKGR